MKSFKSPILLFSIIISIFFIYATIILANIWPIDSKTIGQAGVFGDSFGVLTSLFSGLAFAGLLITIWQQKDEIEITRKDIQTQHFENILFKMLEMHNNIVMDIDLRVATTSSSNKEGDIIATGRDCFEIFYNDLTNISSTPDLEKNYEEFWSIRKKDLGHYFRNLYTLFKFINEAPIKEKKTYTNIVRAQLSDYELVILFYNCISRYGREKFKPLVERYHLLNNMPLEFLLDQQHKNLFDNEAFV